MTKTANIKKREGSPEFVLGSFGFKYDELKEFVNDKGYINFDILLSKEGNKYIKVNDFGLKKETKEESKEVLKFAEDEIPF